MRMTMTMVSACLGVLSTGCAWEPQDLLLTRDQQGRRLFERGEYAEAAARFEDPIWKGTSLYLAERFDQALDQFARVDTPEAWFARGNALAHLERYEEAVAA